MTSLIVPASGSRPQWHELDVVSVERLTTDAVAVTVHVPPRLQETFDFAPGQHLTLRGQVAGQDVRRDYSICMPHRRYQATGQLRIASARVETGAMSNWLNEHMAPGRTLTVLPPRGDFTRPTEPDRSKHHVAIAAGSGITPVLSLLYAVLEEEPRSRFTLMLGNRSPETVMFGEELRDVASEYADRFELIEVFSRDPPDGRQRRIDDQMIEDFVVDYEPVDEWYLCGPKQLVEAAQEVLARNDVDPQAVHREVFYEG